MICPRCDGQGLIYNAKVIELGILIKICDECEACWLENQPITLENFKGLTAFLEENGLTYKGSTVIDLGYNKIIRKTKMNHLKNTSTQLILLLFICCYTSSINSSSNNFIMSTVRIAFLSITKYLQRIKCSMIDKYTEQYKAWFKPKIESSISDKILTFRNALASNHILELITHVQCDDLIIAEAAFCILKKYWPWDREYTFLIPHLDKNSEESDFIKKLGYDIMGDVERDLITRPDYIVKYTDEQSFKTILEYTQKCVLLVEAVDTDTLLNEIKRLCIRVIKNGKKTILVDNICLAIAEKLYTDPITKLLHTVKYAPTLEEAHQAVLAIEKYVLEQEKKGVNRNRSLALYDKKE